MDLSLYDGDLQANISYAGDGVVLLSIYSHKTQEHDLMPFYFETKAKCLEYIIKFTNTLLTEQGFKVVCEDNELR